MVQGRAHLSFAVTYDNVKWLSSASHIWSADMPREALDLVSRDISNDQILIGSATSLKFYSKQSFDFFKKTPEKGAITFYILSIIKEYKGDMDKRPKWIKTVEDGSKELKRLIKLFQSELKKRQANSEAATVAIVGGAALKKVEKASKIFDAVYNELGKKVVKKDYKKAFVGGPLKLREIPGLVSWVYGAIAYGNHAGTLGAWWYAHYKLIQPLLKEALEADEKLMKIQVRNEPLEGILIKYIDIKKLLEPSYSD